MEPKSKPPSPPPLISLQLRGQPMATGPEQAKVCRTSCSLPDGRSRSPALSSMVFVMIATKLSRILTGDPDFRDHWDDIAGCQALHRPGARSETHLPALKPQASSSSPGAPSARPIRHRTNRMLGRIWPYHPSPPSGPRPHPSLIHHQRPIRTAAIWGPPPRSLSHQRLPLHPPCNDIEYLCGPRAEASRLPGLAQVQIRPRGIRT